MKNLKVRNHRLIAAAAIEAAEAQHTVVPGEKLAAAVVARLAREVAALDEAIAETGALIECCSATTHTPDRLAGVAGPAPASKDSGRISGNMRRPRRYCRRLLRVFYMSAQVAARSCPVSKAFYERKRAEKKAHNRPSHLARSIASGCGDR
ncbi:transposase [Streptomyces sp. NPDC101149]|uniref:transposase n=1 Tax=Streptomyces sp. NPDC101149 TaxID=3366113 RepID=UPI0037FE2D19